ncbi:LysR family transcriptional regulator [Alicyclobacillus sp. SO9]|uniref:LysR family transcriptional regulator n=1 Tax=Alicyclobacillus sp. SO9 TaxID=2665646 RepID=UPI0018E76D0E|nr:LysR family transcriptional regulator [Alicyclobacillus sp. SO9]QQE79240.1 LysR family transcriptional regulator [Alicyclobacillus sp. SO9]
MDINAFKMFLAVANMGSVTKAAEHLNYAQSNVTSRIQQLEKELGKPLFYRHHKKLTLTPAGQELLPYANKLLQDFNEVMDVVEDTSMPRGTLSIGTMDSTAAVRLPKVLAQYYRLYPQVELNVVTAPTEKLVDNVLQYTLEGAFVDGPVEHSDLIEHFAFEEQLVLVTPATNQLFELERILHEPLLTAFVRCRYVARWQRWLRDEGHKPMKVIEFGMIDTVLRCIENGFGVAVLPKSMVSSWVVKGSFNYYPLPDGYASIPTMFIRRKDAYASSALRYFTTLIDIELD